jgi:hypothetical protein
MRVGEKDFLARVLEDVEGLPEGLKERLLGLLDAPSGEQGRAEAIRALFEERGDD